MLEINAVITIGFRDVLKFLRDRARIVATFIFPIIFIGVLGGSLQSNLAEDVGFNFMTFIFVGVIAQTLFQSSAAGIISLIEDRENDFSQELFVSPVSRYTIVMGKILGESVVALLQVMGIIVFGMIMRIPFNWEQLLNIIPAMFLLCLFGGSFGILVMSQLSNQRAANQIFPFLIFPQFFIAGVFTPIKDMPLPLLVASRIAPMTYAVDFARSLFYWGTPEYDKIVLFHPLVSLSVMSVLFLFFIIIGTYFFVRNERNR